MTLSCEAVAQAVLGEPIKRVGAEFVWACPHPASHKNGDANPSLKVNPQKNVWACFPCNVGGTAWQLAAFIAALNPADKQGVTAWLRERGVVNGKRRLDKKSAGPNRPVVEYTYHNIGGEPVARKLRFEPKSFAWQRLENGVWVDGLGGVKMPLYRLPEIKDAPLVVLTEGEKDADAGAKIGLPTTTSGGTGSFSENHAEALRGKDVVVVADADAPGRAEAQKRAAMLHGRAASVAVCEIPGSKDLAEAIEKDVPLNVLRALFEDTPEWKPAMGAETLDSLLCFVRRFVSLTENQARVVVLWAAHAHAIEAADCTAYLDVNSPEKGSGKTRLLEVLELLVNEPWLTGRVTAAVLIRKIDAIKPTLLLDESDTAFGSEKEYVEALRGVLNSGYRRGGKASCCVGQGANVSFKDFETFCAKAIAGIGRLPDTVADRSIPIRLNRARRGETEKFRKREVEQEAGELKSRLAAWCAVNLKKLRDARPALPCELSDRQADCCEPLLAIADLAAGDWPESARRAIVELCCAAQKDDQSIGVRLLADVRTIFEVRDVDRISSADLVEALAEVETTPWSEWSHGKPISKAKLARLLARFPISPGTVRLSSGNTAKGYYSCDFTDAWERYLAPAHVAPDSKRHNVTPPENIGGNGDFENVTANPCDVSENGKKTNKNASCDVVTFSDQENGAEASPRGANGHAKRWVGPPPRPVPCATCGQILESALALSRHWDQEHSPQNGVQQ